MLLATILVVVLLLINGTLVMAELALMTSRQSRLQHAAARGSGAAAAALALSRDPTAILSTVQVGISLIGILAGAYGEKVLTVELQRQLEHYPAIARYSEAISFAVVVLCITYLYLVFGELVPKRIALAYPERAAMAVSRPLRLVTMVMAAPVKVLTLSTEGVLRLVRVPKRRADDVSEEDVQSLVARAAATGVITKQEHALFKRLFRAGDLTVRDLMVPRSEIIWIEENTPIDELRVLIGTSPYSHFPVCRGGLDDLVGVVHIKDLIAYGLVAGQSFGVSSVAHSPLFVPDTIPVLRLLDMFRSTRTHVAFIVDEYGATQGLATLNDVVAALVGDISRRGEQEPPRARKRDDGSWLLDGRLALHEMVTAMSIPPEAEAELPDVSTVAGLLMEQLGRIPVEGDKTRWHGYEFEVVDTDGTKVDKVLARLVGPAVPPSQDSGA